MSSDRRRTATGLALLALLAACAVTGCGKQGPPLPPLRNVPAATKDLHVRQQGRRAVLDLAYPKTTASGMALDGLTAIEVWEVVQPAPVSGKPQPPDLRVFQATAKMTQKLTGADVGAASFGDRLIFAIPLPESALTAAAAVAAVAPAPASAPTPAPSPPPPTAMAKPGTPAVPTGPRGEAHFYAVRTVSKANERSDFSNLAALVPKVPPAPPEKVTLTAHADGILVGWSPAERAIGYAIYRRGAAEKAFGPPVHAAPPTDRSWLDNTARFGQAYIYTVTSFSERDPFIESAITSEHEIHYLDRFPPPVPADLVALAENTENGRIRLVWRAVDADDLAGYIVYRREGSGEFRRLTEKPLAAAEYVDTVVKPGATYSYRVTAIDQNGNESAPGGEARAVLP